MDDAYNTSLYLSFNQKTIHEFNRHFVMQIFHIVFIVKELIHSDEFFSPKLKNSDSNVFKSFIVRFYLIVKASSTNFTAMLVSKYV